ncbi:hypothetical protein D3C71_153430 [compost metagenome]
MRVIARSEHDKKRGAQLDQWLAGCIGAAATTLPSFAVMPVWFAFIHNYAVVDDNGKEDSVACGMICFIAGMLVWAAAAFIGFLFKS